MHGGPPVLPLTSHQHILTLNRVPSPQSSVVAVHGKFIYPAAGLLLLWLYEFIAMPFDKSWWQWLKQQQLRDLKRIPSQSFYLLLISAGMEGRTRQNTQVNQHSIRLTHLQLLQLSPRQGEGGGGGGIASLLYYFLCTSFCGSNFGQVTARVCFRFTFPFLPGKAPN